MYTNKIQPYTTFGQVSPQNIENGERFNRLFLLMGGLMVWTYMMAPDVQTTMVALKTRGVKRNQIAALWAVSLVGIGLFINQMYKERILPR